MNVTRRPAISPASEHFDTETLALLEAVEVPLPEFTDIDVSFGAPLEMYEAGELDHERWAGVDMASTLDALYARMDADRDIVRSDPAVTELVRERLVDLLLPYAAQMRIAPPTAASLPIAA
ncbi:hypothetical protein [Streptomyces sp. NPDC058424]|uniref:hypothetical protein n=1 Tax=Streptomyces sp. NPDC058424 TaxID=3346491 RepID=UPI00365F2240